MFYIELLMEDFELVVAEEYKFEKWAISIVKTLLWTYALSRQIWCQEYQPAFLPWKILNWKNLMPTLMEKKS